MTKIRAHASEPGATAPPIQALFLDIGGVLLTNGWDRQARGRAAERYRLEPDDFEERHHMTFDAYERGALNLDEYLNRVVFHRPRTFTREAFTAFMFSQSQAHEDMIALVRHLKEAFGLRVAAVSNEGRELMLYRIRLFGLSSFVDAFIGSAFIGHRKPELAIYRMALDVMQVPPEAIVYLDDREMFVQLARELGIRSIHHESYAATRAALASLGLRLSPAKEHPHSGSH